MAIRRHAKAAGLAVLVVALVIVGGTLWNRPPGDLEGRWQAATLEVDGQAISWTDDTVPTLTLSLESGRVEGHGTAGCNKFGSTARYRWDGSLSWSDWISTLIGCPAPVAEVETAFLGSLGRVDHVAIDGDELLLTGDDVRLTFTRLTG